MMRKQARLQDRLLIGWREWVGLPDLQVDWIKAKIDTGARTSAIHAWNIAEHGNGRTREVTFDLHPVQRDNGTIVSCRAPLVGTRQVRSSSGHSETRHVIRTTLALGDRSWEIELTLTNRDEMGFRMLLGRTALRGRVIIDPGRSFMTRRLAPKRSADMTGEKSP
ncbi:MAG: ATP-dependent zinc protease [Alphaproteobacteria bacterium]|nr:MAG: ATP-dependent zinc protease [Alphaproteobacteria bacterium]